jgi:4-hydroxybenzoate polyprenyltransferase
LEGILLETSSSSGQKENRIADMPRPVAQGKASRVADARATNLVDRLAPAALLPYLRLARVDRPTGFWLLAIPCFWSVALASRSIGADYPDAWLLVLFAIGAVVMRAAGCTYNDIVDKDIDAKVARTHSRPLPSGEVSERSATIFMLVLCMIGLAVLLSFNAATVWLGLCVVPLVALYPLVKRYSYWPQAVLGLAFNWGVLLGYSAVLGRLELPAVVLYAGAIAWIRASDQGLALRVLCACLARNHRSRALGRGRDRVPAWHGGCGCPSLLASGHARYRRSGQLPAALPVEPRFRVDRIRGHRARSGSRFAVLGAGNEPGPRDARPEAR